MSQLCEKSGQKFLPDTAPGDGAKPSPEAGAKSLPKPLTPPCEVSDKSDDSYSLDKEVSHSLMGSKQPDVADSITKRRSQMGLVQTLTVLLILLSRNCGIMGGDIASRSYAEREVDHHGVTFSTPDNENVFVKISSLLYINM